MRLENHLWPPSLKWWSNVQHSCENRKKGPTYISYSTFISTHFSCSKESTAVLLNLPVGLCWARNSMLGVFLAAFSLKFLSLLHCRCPCLTWPDTRRGNAFVQTDMSGGGAPNALLSIASIQDTVCKCSCTMQLNWPMATLSLIPALFCLKGGGGLVMGHKCFFLQCQGDVCLQIKQWISLKRSWNSPHWKLILLLNDHINSSRQLLQNFSGILIHKLCSLEGFVEGKVSACQLF